MQDVWPTCRNAYPDITPIQAGRLVAGQFRRVFGPCLPVVYEDGSREGPGSRDTYESRTGLWIIAREPHGQPGNAVERRSPEAEVPGKGRDDPACRVFQQCTTSKGMCLDKGTGRIQICNRNSYQKVQWRGRKNKMNVYDRLENWSQKAAGPYPKGGGGVTVLVRL